MKRAEARLCLSPVRTRSQTGARSKTSSRNIWLCGGGAVIAPLRQSIADTLDMRIHQSDELIPGGQTVEGINSLIQAVGITME